MPEPSDWLKKRVDEWAAALWLQDWHIYINTDSVPNHNNPGADATTMLEPKYNRAYITFRLGLAENDETEELVVHELVHIMHARIDQLIEDIVIPALSSELRGTAIRAYNDIALEPFVSNLGECLMKLRGNPDA